MPYDPDDSLQYQAELDRLTRTFACSVLFALKQGAPANTRGMVEAIAHYMSDNSAAADLVQRTARGENAFGELLQKLALDEGEQQARIEIESAARRRKESHDDDRIDRALDARAA